MYKGKTASGFEYEIDEAVANDMEFLDLLADIDENPIYLGKVFQMLLGKEQKKALYDHLRDEAGRVPVDKAGDALVEIMSAAGDDTKN